MKAPFVILSNGREHWFWNYTRHDQDAYRIERLPSRLDLERLRLKNLQPPRPLMSEIVTPDYLKKFRADLVVRGYQQRAMDAVSRLFDEKALRKFLLEMATGTGKTLLCAALIRRFLTTRNAERVLFIVDRIELARQTLEEFAVILPEYKPVLFKTARRRPGELLGSSVVVATLQSLMVDRRYLNKVHLANCDGICSTDIYVLRPRSHQIHPSFAANYLRSPSVLFCPLLHYSHVQILHLQPQIHRRRRPSNPLD